jgi:hypothetical protein
VDATVPTADTPVKSQHVVVRDRHGHRRSRQAWLGDLASNVPQANLLTRRPG